jgi:hypothetical protein
MFYLKVVEPKRVTEGELENVYEVIQTKNKKPLTLVEKINVKENINSEKNRIGTLDAIEIIVQNYSPSMKEFKSQMGFFRLCNKFKEFDYSKFNYFEFSNDEYDLLIKLITHDNYVNRTPDGKEVPVRDVAGILHDITSMPNVKPDDYEKK